MILEFVVGGVLILFYMVFLICILRGIFEGFRLRLVWGSLEISEFFKIVFLYNIYNVYVKVFKNKIIYFWINNFGSKFIFNIIVLFY